MLATGTWTGSSLDKSWLRINRLNNSSANGLTTELGIAQSPKKFTSLDWVDSLDEFGTIAGGMEDGAITLWNVKKILEDQNGQAMGRGCISAAQLHPGIPVNTVEFNPNRKSLLASGGAEVLILDIEHNIKRPNKFKPGEPNFHEGSHITSISWNL
jgi:WD40 repeat protein